MASSRASPLAILSRIGMWPRRASAEPEPQEQPGTTFPSMPRKPKPGPPAVWPLQGGGPEEEDDDEAPGDATKERAAAASEGARAERERLTAILTSPEGRKRPDTALCLAGSMASASAADVVATLASLDGEGAFGHLAPPKALTGQERRDAYYGRDLSGPAPPTPPPTSLLDTPEGFAEAFNRVQDRARAEGFRPYLEPLK